MQPANRAGPAAVLGGTRLALVGVVLLTFELVAEGLRNARLDPHTVGFMAAFAIPIALLGVFTRRGSLLAYALGVALVVGYSIALDTVGPGSVSFVGTLLQVVLVGFVAAPTLAWRRERKLSASART